ncbi:SDR family NAD(P)-dependent oxidoreductase [Phototrophicus methaneseepsis]|uniref:SDR family NAD(P)-dependent oxidoreductase n=1 Tax=Phototrophicus methaneseepsis TaxID=2710758 RepID=A0A7S8IF87_9CHLR|nr:SDR family NAD(P)-dependent oxidoreductase [Phototrophicus methaneseepsis]QPC84450.1 SDR family NAD(P)-dependent oxidoreductase [Phototrophicus methaneseepsis]
MKILVTGAAGFIGSHLAETLVRDGHTVVAIDNLNDYYPTAIKHHNANELTRQGVQLFQLDLAEDDLSAAVDGVEAIFHCAAQPGISSKVTYDTYVRNNLGATQNLLQATKSLPTIKRFVNVATSSIYGSKATSPEDIAAEPISYYGVTKLAAEQLVLAQQRESGFPALSFRLFSVYGPRERPDKLYPRLIHSIVDGNPFPLYEDSLGHSRSFTYVGDVVKAFIKALDHDACVGEIFNIGTTASITTGEAISIVEDLLGKKANTVLKPRRIGDQKQTAAVIDKAQRILGYHPDTPFVEGIQHMITWYQGLPADVRALYKPAV